MDDTENARRALLRIMQGTPATREEIEKYYQVWDTGELSRDFDVLGFMAPFCVVRRRVDGVKGSVMFQHRPRLYFNFVPR